MSTPSLVLGRRPALVGLALVAVVFIGTAGAQAWSDAPTIDEGYNIAAGTSGLTRHDLRMLPEHALLTKVLAGGGALIAQPSIPRSAAWDRGAWFDYTKDFNEAQPAGSEQRLYFWARVPFLLLGLVIAAELYALGSRLFDRGAGVAAAALWCTTPFTVGFGHLASVDLTFTAALLAVSLALDRYRSARSDAGAGLVGLACGGAMLARHTGVVAVAASLLVVIAANREVRRVALRAVAVVLLVTVVVVWAGYRAVDPTGPDGHIAAPFEGLIDVAGEGRPLTALVLATPLPLEYRAGAAFLIADKQPEPAYLAGEAWSGGRWWYFPAVALIRLPPTCTLALLAGAVGLALRRGRRRRALAALLPAGALAIVLVVQPLDLGLRYALPVLAAGMVLAGSLLATRSRAALVVLVIVVLGQLGSAVVATPHSLAWTSPVFRPGFRWTADLDIGQDRRDVVRWSAHRTARTALLLEPGQAGPPGDGLLIGVDPSAIIGWVVVSSALLTTLARDELAWLRKYCPVHAIGGTVLVYRFARAPDPSAGPARPRDLCARRFSDRR